MAIQTIRTVREVIERYDSMTIEGREDVELDEYLSEIEDYRDIDRTAKAYLGYMVRNIGRCRWLQVRQAIRQYVAWKWMLGHEDADTFPGSDAQPGHDLRISYIYLRDQIQNGEWDRLTKEGLQQSRSRSIVEIPRCENLAASVTQQEAADNRAHAQPLQG